MRAGGTAGTLPFPELAVLLLPLKQMARENVHHLDTAEFLEVFVVRRRIAVAAVSRCRRGLAAIAAGRGHRAVDLVDHAL